MVTLVLLFEPSSTCNELGPVVFDSNLESLLLSAIRKEEISNSLGGEKSSLIYGALADELVQLVGISPLYSLALSTFCLLFY